MARSKLTDEFIDDFCNAISLGLSINAACDYCSISNVSYFSYINKAKDELEKGVKNSKYIKFFNRVKKAKSHFKMYHMAKIREAAESGSWQASAWSLERCFPDEYGKSVQVETSDNGVIGSLLRAIEEVQKEK